MEEYNRELIRILHEQNDRRLAIRDLQQLYIHNCKKEMRLFEVKRILQMQALFKSSSAASPGISGIGSKKAYTQQAGMLKNLLLQKQALLKSKSAAMYTQQAGKNPLLQKALVKSRSAASSGKGSTKAYTRHAGIAETSVPGPPKINEFALSDWSAGM